MAAASDIKFYKSNNNGLGGNIDTSSLITSGNHNNLFPILTKAEADAGSVQYLLMYIKNTGADKLKKVSFRLSASTPFSGSRIAWAKGIAGKNGIEPTIANITTAPAGVVDWLEETGYVNLFDFGPGDTYGIWVRWTTEAGVGTIRDDNAIFRWIFTLPAGSVPVPPDSSGGGTGNGGGNPPPTPTNWKIAVVGDWGTESASDKVMKMCQSHDFIISCGDNAYGDDSGFKTMIEKYGLKSKGIWAFGNHDSPNTWKSYFGYSKTYNYRTFQNVAVIAMDAAVNIDTGSPQVNQIETWLNQAQNDPNIDWIFACGHYPWFGASSQHSYDDGGQVEALMDRFLQFKVGFVFCAHNHNWQRTKYVKRNSGSPTSPTVVDSTSPFVNDGTGLIHVVSGAGGHDSGGSLYSLGSQPSFQAFQQTKQNNGIYQLVASNNGQTLTCQFVSTDGTTFDTITYTKT